MDKSQFAQSHVEEFSKLTIEEQKQRLYLRVENNIRGVPEDATPIIENGVIVGMVINGVAHMIGNPIEIFGDLSSWTEKLCVRSGGVPNNVTEYVLPDYVEALCEGDLAGCDRLERLIVGPGLKRIEKFALDGMALYSTIEYRGPLMGFLAMEGKTEVGYERYIEAKFDDVAGTTIIVPGTVEEIPDGCFFQLQGYEKLILSEGVKHIGAQAIAETSITETILPVSLKSLGSRAIQGTTLYMGSREQFVNIEGKDECYFNVYFPNEASNELVPVSPTKKGYLSGDRALISVQIGADCREIAENAFYQCGQLKRIVTHPFLEETGLNCLFQVDLEEIDVVFDQPEDWIFANHEAYEKLAEQKETKVRLFLKDLDHEIIEFGVPKGIDALPYDTFGRCKNLTSIIVPEGVKSLGSFCFCDCPSLQRLELPASLEKIDPRAFAYIGSPALTVIYAGSLAELDRLKAEKPFGIHVQCVDGEAYV